MGQTLREPTHEPRPVVLVVDDDSGLLESLELVLEGRYEVIKALSGPVALAVVRSRSVDAVVLDIVMPGPDGLLVLEQMKAISPDLEVILLTGLKNEAVAATGIKYGAFDYLTKPFEEEHLLALVADAVEKRHRGRVQALLIGSDTGVLAAFALLMAPYASIVTATPAQLPDPARGASALVVYDSVPPPHLAAEFVQSLRERFARSAIVVLEKPYRLDEALDRVARSSPSLDRLAVLSTRLGPHLIKLVDHVARSYPHPLDSSDLARAVGLSVDRLAHLVRDRLGLALMEFVTRFRVEVARHLLAVTELGLEEVAEKTGFAGASNLSRAFLHCTGLRPGEYRRTSRGAGELRRADS